jgi:hypothetical protein
MKLLIHNRGRLTTRCSVVEHAEKYCPGYVYLSVGTSMSG